MVKNLSTYSGDPGDIGSIPVLGRSSGVGNGNPLQYSCLENFMDRKVWQATIEGVAKSQTQLSTHVSKTSHWVPRLDTLSGVSVSVLFTDEMRSAAEDSVVCFPQVGWTSSNLLKE